MLNIRNDQIGMLSERMVSNFVNRALLHIRAHFPDRVLNQTDEQLRREIGDAIKRAGEFNFSTERQIMCFIDVEVILGRYFYDDPRYLWMKAVLKSSSLNDDDRSRVLLSSAFSVIDA